MGAIKVGVLWFLVDPPGLFFEGRTNVLCNTMLRDFGKWCWKALVLGDGKSASDHD